jgi:hypothetical protein
MYIKHLAIWCTSIERQPYHKKGVNPSKAALPLAGQPPPCSAWEQGRNRGMRRPREQSAGQARQRCMQWRCTPQLAMAKCNVGRRLLIKIKKINSAVHWLGWLPLAGYPGEIFFIFFINIGDHHHNNPTFKGLNRLKVLYYSYLQL